MILHLKSPTCRKSIAKLTDGQLAPCPYQNKPNPLSHLTHWLANHHTDAEFGEPVYLEYRASDLSS